MSWFSDDKNVFNNSIVIGGNKGEIKGASIVGDQGTINISLGSDFVFRWRKGSMRGKISIDAETEKKAKEKAVKELRKMSNIHLDTEDLY